MYVCMYLCMYNKTIDEYSKNMLKCMYACERLSLCMWTGGFSNFVCTVCMFICIYKCIYIFLYACNMEVCTMAWCHWIFIIVCVFKLILCYLLCSLFRSECQRRELLPEVVRRLGSNPIITPDEPPIHPSSFINKYPTTTPSRILTDSTGDGRLVQVCMYVCM